MTDRLRNVSNLPPFVLLTRLLMVAFPLVALWALVYGALSTGPWYDEFWTLYFSDPAVTLKQALFDRWVVDVHPPFFSFMAWLAAGLNLPRTIEAGRLFNLLPLAVAAAFVVLYWRNNARDRTFLAVYVPAVIALGQFANAFAEFRSYFLSMCAFALLMICLKRIDRRKDDPLVGANRKLVWTGYTVNLLICLNIHFVTAIVSVGLVAAFALAALLRREVALFVTYLLTGLACSLPLLATTGLQWSYLSTMSHDFWLKTSTTDAVILILQAIIMPLFQGLALRLVWLAAFCLRILARTTSRDDDRYAGILILSFLTCSVLLLGYTAATGALTSRYLIPVCVTATAVLSASMAETIVGFRLLHAAFLACCMAAVVQTALASPNALEWNEGADFVAAHQKACPGARIIPMRVNPLDRTANSLASYQLAFEYLARQRGMSIGAVDQPPSTPRHAGCADYYWIDNLPGSNKTADTLQEELLQRFPTLAGCRIEMTPLHNYSVVFAVSGEPPACNR